MQQEYHSLRQTKRQKFLQDRKTDKTLHSPSGSTLKLIEVVVVGIALKDLDGGSTAELLASLAHRLILHIGAPIIHISNFKDGCHICVSEVVIVVTVVLSGTKLAEPEKMRSGRVSSYGLMIGAFGCVWIYGMEAISNNCNTTHSE